MRRFLNPAALLSALALFLTACATDALNLVTSRAGYTATNDIPYGPDPRQRFDLYVPDGATPQTPVVVFVHGGSWDSGSKDIYRFVGQSFAAQGFILAVPNYRLYPQVTFPGFVQDGARAVAAIDRAASAGAHGVPAGRHPIALMGHSAGAQIAALLAFDGRYLAAAGSSRQRLSAFVGLAGPYDFLPLTEARYERVFPAPTRDQSQAVNYADGRGPATLLVHGTADTTVLPANSVSMADAIGAAGGRVELRLFEGVNHIVPISSFATALPLGNPAIREAVFAFLKAHL